MLDVTARACPAFTSMSQPVLDVVNITRFAAISLREMTAAGCDLPLQTPPVSRGSFARCGRHPDATGVETVSGSGTRLGSQLHLILETNVMEAAKLGADVVITSVERQVE